MVQLLHLSDLHLGPANQAQTVGDYKEDVIPLTERASRIERIERTLTLLGNRLQLTGKSFDAVIVSGDITLANDATGFQMLRATLGRLGGALPVAPNIVVVPGNHDVAWMTAPSTTERYKNFLEHVRSQGYTTPMLDGVDCTLDQADISELLKHVVVDPNLRWAIIPVNSANYCGSLAALDGVSEDQWSEWAERVDGSKGGSAARAFSKLRLRDMPRISPWQFGKLSAVVAHLDAKVAHEKIVGGIKKIVVVHHQLLPVSDEEEVKPYESIVNLGLLRSFLADHRIDILLHGHKHVGRTYRDVIAIPPSPMHSVVVVSGGTVGMGAPLSDACRLIDLDLGLPSAPRVRVSNVPGLSPGRVLPPDSFANVAEFDLWPDAPTAGVGCVTPVQITGESVRETYERVQAFFQRRSSTDRIPVTCTVVNPSDATELPPTYPPIPGVENRQEWLKSVVEWWQLKGSKVGHDKLHFTHGERIYNYGGSINQLNSAVEALRTNDTNARAVITLLDPKGDRTALSGRWPSFCLVQFVIRSEDGTRYLDAIAYFRHQEMAYWWPVNVAEIASVQAAVLRDLGSRPPIHAGRITTVSPLAHAGAAPTFVAVPEIDRMFDANETDLWSMVYALIWKDIPGRTAFRDRWKSLLEDLVPNEGGDPKRAPVSIRGLGYLFETLKQFIKHHPGSELEKFFIELEQLLIANTGYFNSVVESRADRIVYDTWRGTVHQGVQRAMVSISTLFPDMQTRS